MKKGKMSRIKRNKRTVPLFQFFLLVLLFVIAFSGCKKTNGDTIVFSKREDGVSQISFCAEKKTYGELVAEDMFDGMVLMEGATPILLTDLLPPTHGNFYPGMSLNELALVVYGDSDINKYEDMTLSELRDEFDHHYIYLESNENEYQAEAVNAVVFNTPCLIKPHINSSVPGTKLTDLHEGNVEIRFSIAFWLPEQDEECVKLFFDVREKLIDIFGVPVNKKINDPFGDKDAKSIIEEGIPDILAVGWSEGPAITLRMDSENGEPTSLNILLG